MTVAMRRWSAGESQVLASLSMRRAPHLWSLLLVPAGVAGGHLLTCLWAGAVGADGPAMSGHSYLQGMTCLAVPLGLAALARGVVAGVSSEAPPVRFPFLAAVQVALFVGVELAEQAANGSALTDTVSVQATVLGVVAQVAVAWTLCAAVRAASRAVSRLASQRTSTTATSSKETRWKPRSSRATPCVAVSSLSRRGPPLLLV